MLANETAYALARELMSYVAQEAGLGAWIWRRHTRSMPEGRRLITMQKANTYIAEFRRVEAEMVKRGAKT